MTTTITHNLDELKERLRLTLDAAEALEQAYETNDKDHIRNRLSELTRAQNRLEKWQLMTDTRMENKAEPTIKEQINNLTDQIAEIKEYQRTKCISVLDHLNKQDTIRELEAEIALLMTKPQQAA